MTTVDQHLEAPGPLPAPPPGRLLSTPPVVELPRPGLEHLLALVDAAGLRGHGGAAFPTATKLRAVAVHRPGGRRHRPVVVGNAMEGEPLSRKDATLLDVAPHLVVEGLAIAAGAVGASRAVLAVATDRASSADRGPGSRVADVASRHGVDVTRLRGSFLAGQESALVNALTGRPAVPSDPLVRVTERGVGGRPTVVLNAETLALLALVVRFGPDAAGTRLLTLSGDLAAPGVVESSRAATVRAVLGRGRPGRTRAVLVGGYHGVWAPADELDVPLTEAGIGAGVLHVLGVGRCGLRATADVAGYLARESAGQCGPCVNALPRVADTIRRLALHEADARVPAEVARLSRLATGRGACAHPDGTVRMVASAMRVFADDVTAHLNGYCLASLR